MHKSSGDMEGKEMLHESDREQPERSLKKTYYTLFRDDITDAGENRGSLDEAVKRAETSESIMRALFDNATDGIVLAEVETEKLVIINRAMRIMLGYDNYPEISLFVKDIHPRDKLPYVRSRFNMLASGEISLTRNIPMQKRDGSVMYMDISGTTISINGRDYIVAVFRDMTEARRAAIEKSELESRIHQMEKMEAIGTLAGGVAHDFNNILSAIMGLTELSLRSGNMDEYLRKNLEYILESCHRARDLVSQLLSISYRGEKKFEALNLVPVIKDAVRLIRATLPATVSIDMHMDAEMDHAMADRTQISRIIMNLCTNAAQAMNAMEGDISIGVSNCYVDKQFILTHPDLREGWYLLVEVRDNGSGIDPSIVDRIFEPFFTTKEKGKGTGLGLSVIHGIVKNHGGSIYVKSTLGEGTLFQVYLPVTDVKAEAMETEESVQLTGSATILLVDDEEILTRVNGGILESMGFAVVTCNSGHEALRVFSENAGSFDVVVTDMTMPGMTGLVLALEIKRIRPEIPVILCTGFNEQLTEERAHEAGVMEIVMKPFTSAELARVIRKALADK